MGINTQSASHPWSLYSIAHQVAGPSATGGTGSGAGRPTVSDITVTLDVGAITPQLYAALAKAQSTTTAIIQLPINERSGLGLETFALTCQSVQLIALDVLRTPLETPLATLTLRFGQVAWQYSPRNSDGNVGAPIMGSFDRRNQMSQGPVAQRLDYLVSDTPQLARSNELVATQFEHSVHNPASGTGTGAGTSRAVPGPAIVQGGVDRNIVSHLVSALRGSVIARTMVRLLSQSSTGTAVEDIRYEFQTVHLQSVAIDAAADGTLQETLTFDYQGARFMAGSETTGWDFIRNMAL